MRWTGARKIVSDKITVIYSGDERHQQGVGVLPDKERAKVLLDFGLFLEE